MIKVKVLSSVDADTEAEKRIVKRPRAKVLTHEYVRQLNKGIAYRIRKNEIGQIEQEGLQELVRKRVFK